MPSIGKDFKGTPEAEYPVFVDCEKDAEAVRPIIKRVSEATTGTFDIDGLDWSQLPTLHHILAPRSSTKVLICVMKISWSHDLTKKSFARKANRQMECCRPIGSL